jgi:hypothetical protein
MAKFLNTQTNEQVILRSQHLFGRHSGSCHTVLADAEASRLHASIMWNGSNWLLQDNSSNGTFLNGEAVTVGTKRRLKQGDVIQFGALNASTWKLHNDDPPCSLLVPLQSGHEVIELTGVLALPDDDSAEMTLYQTSNGDWVFEDDSGQFRLNSGDKLATSQGDWSFIAAETLDSTKQVPHQPEQPLSSFEAAFNVSKNEEHVSLVINSANNSIDLGERTHHYLLLFLARQRIKDMQSGIEQVEQGWIDKDLLCQQIGLDEKYLNIQIFRFRQQLMQVTESSSTALPLLQIIERRRGTLRFAFNAITITGGNELMSL